MALLPSPFHFSCRNGSLTHYSPITGYSMTDTGNCGKYFVTENEANQADLPAPFFFFLKKNYSFISFSTSPLKQTSDFIILLRPFQPYSILHPTQFILFIFIFLFFFLIYLSLFFIFYCSFFFFFFYTDFPLLFPGYLTLIPNIHTYNNPPPRSSISTFLSGSHYSMPTISSTPLDQGSPPSSQHHHPSCHSHTSTTSVPVSSTPADIPSSSIISPLTSPAPTTSSTTTTANTTATTTTSFTGSVIGSISRRNRRSFAALAREKTSNALANLSAIGSTTSSSLRTSTSSGSLSKHSRKPSQISTHEIAGVSPLTPPLSDESTSSNQSSPACIETSEVESQQSLSGRRRHTLQRNSPISEQQLEAGFAALPSKMHQTSSRLLRMTEDDRPFTKVWKEKKTGASSIINLSMIHRMLKSLETIFVDDLGFFFCRILWTFSRPLWSV